MSERVTNWAGNIVFGAKRLHRPESAEQIQDLVAAGGPLRVLGSGHSFNRMADTDGDLISLADLPRIVEISPDRRSVRVDGGIRYGDLAVRLYEEGLALHNMASLPHISVAGAVATATHGSGARNANLATAVSSVELIDGTGRPVTLTRDDPDFLGVVVGLGAPGIVTALTLDVVEAFELRQYVYDTVPRASIESHLAEMLADGYSVSLFTDWTGLDANMGWLKRASELSGDWFGARRADGPRHPVPGMPPANSTDQSGEPGPWHTRLPHFRMEFTPSAGAELQSEWHVAAGDALAAIDAVASIRSLVASVLQVCEIRAIAADELWLSPNYHRNSVALHFTWIADTDAVLPVVAAVEERLAPLHPRPHWGKVFTTPPWVLAADYERFGDFQDLVRRYDPAGTFRNPWLDAILGDVK
ncbi:FAD-binding protein [Paractinoplanes toevensis]|uniref:Xylitol oxidase n=1 Tax=Paractinoplanes toevensis TaxID=571911 RepID=A0A919W781_9ACTN|nr:FAD-binding protein [Actinoplanes toevensis]GIM88506.1 putative xylitol oxidase [Actinoplanes toevensis]